MPLCENAMLCRIETEVGKPPAGHCPSYSLHFPAANRADLNEFSTKFCAMGIPFILLSISKLASTAVKFAGSEFERHNAALAMKVGWFSPQAKEAPPE
jgi:hypothetical protein